MSYETTQEIKETNRRLGRIESLLSEILYQQRQPPAIIRAFRRIKNLARLPYYSFKECYWPRLWGGKECEISLYDHCWHIGEYEKCHFCGLNYTEVRARMYEMEREGEYASN